MYSSYPTGVTYYDPDQCCNGYTLVDIRSNLGTPLVDMNGNVQKFWDGFGGYPPRLLPGGDLICSSADRPGDWQDQVDICQIDWDGNLIWKFDRWEQVQDETGNQVWMARQHHDWQREGSTAGYYTPTEKPQIRGGNTLILAHTNCSFPEIHNLPLHDNVIYEITWDGKIIWQWRVADYFDQFGFNETARAAIRKSKHIRGKNNVDWFHANSLSLVGANPWFDSGDNRFHPDNIITSSPVSNIVCIISKSTGNIVWQIGPDYSTNPALAKLGWIIGQHKPHMIPRGLPGEGNMLLFDNGGSHGYGVPHINSPDGTNNVQRPYSRVIEFNPVTLEKIWEYSPDTLNWVKFKAHNFYSPYISGAQRLTNGNTLITVGSEGRVIEVTPSLDIAWEYVSPYTSKPFQRGMAAYNSIYRAYRVPYVWVPQLNLPVEKRVKPIANADFRLQPVAS